MIGGDGLSEGEFACASFMVLQDDLWMWISDQPLITLLLRHVEDVVDLDDAVVRIASLEPWNVRQNVTRPADITHSLA